MEQPGWQSDPQTSPAYGCLNRPGRWAVSMAADEGKVVAFFFSFPTLPGQCHVKAAGSSLLAHAEWGAELTKSWKKKKKTKHAVSVKPPRFCQGDAFDTAPPPRYTVTPPQGSAPTMVPWPRWRPGPGRAAHLVTSFFPRLVPYLCFSSG